MKRAQRHQNRNINLPLIWIIGSFIGACGNSEPVEFRSAGTPMRSSDSQSEDARPVNIFAFTSGSLETEVLSIDTGFGLVRQTVLMEQKPKTELALTQIDRPIQTANFTQGHGGDQDTESFAVAEAGLFDLLIVIDDSSSMSPYQNRLADSLLSILKHISNTNWQIAVTTTTSSCLNVTGNGTRILSRVEYDHDSDFIKSEFRSLIRIGEGGDSTERGILTMTDALRGNCRGNTNPWLRDDSMRAVLLVTDEHNCGSASNEGCVGSEYETAQYFFDHAPDDVTVNGLLLLSEPPAADPGNPNDPNHDCQGSGGYLDPPNPIHYLDIINATGGFFADICRSDYSNVLEQMSQNVKDKINFQFELNFAPVANSTQVSIDGKKIKDFQINRRTLTINESIPPNSTQLEVRYKHSPLPRKKRFNLSHRPDSKTIAVSIDGNRLDHNQYQFDPDTNEIVFKNEPPDRSRIQIDFRNDDPLEDEFSVPHDFIQGSLEVFVDRNLVSDVDINRSQRQVKFKTPPNDRAKILIRYARQGDQKETYQVQGIDTKKLEKFRVIDPLTLSEVEVYLEGDELRFPYYEIHDKRKIIVEYDLAFNEEERKFSIPLKENIFKESLKIEANGDHSVCLQNLQLDQDRLSFQCEQDSMEIIDVKYTYSKNYENVFEVPTSYLGPKKWHVLVNGKPIDQFHVFDRTIIILKDYLPPGSEVKIEVSPLEKNKIPPK